MGHLRNLLKKLSGADDGFSYDFYKNGEHELIKKVSRLKFKTIFDVGSNLNKWTLIANKFFPEANIHSFEISETCFMNSKIDPVNEKIIQNNFGLGDINASIEYKDYGTNSQINTTILESNFHDNGSTIYELKKTNIETGNKYCKKNNINFIDFLKIDTEGSEHLVINGFLDILDREAVRLIQFEYGYANGDAKFLMKDFFNFFEKKNYIVAKLRKKIKFKVWDYSFNDFKSGPNYIAIRKNDTEIKSILENS
jgi:FkbM family methyltransferase